MATRPPQSNQEAPPTRRIPWWLLAIVAAGIAIAAFQWFGRGDSGEKTPLSEVARLVQDGQVQSIEVSGESLNITLKDGTELTSNREPDSSLTDSLANFGVTDEQLANVEVV